MILNRFGIIRLSTLTPVVSVGHPKKNVEEIILGVNELSDADIILTPELSITGYSCGDLFTQELLLQEAWNAVLSLADRFKGADQLLVVGCPIRVSGACYNCAVVINQGAILGLVPKQYPPNYREFYEGRHFASGFSDLPPTACVYGRDYPFGTNLLFRSQSVVVGIEICEDLWVPLPPSSFMAVAGANILLNLSASNETVGKAEYRTELVRQQSARCIAVYAYCSAGPSESTAGTVFSGHNIICENGSVGLQSARFEQRNHSQTIDIDIEKINHDRIQTNSFALCKRMLPHDYRYEEFYLNASDKAEELAQYVSATPFVPNATATKDSRCNEIFKIQVCGLTGRLKSLTTPENPKIPKIVLGVSGGLDSTLALLVACETYDALGWSRKNILGRSLPGFGTSNRTRENSLKLCQNAGIDFQVIDIRPQCIQMFIDLNYDPFGIKITEENHVIRTPFEQAELFQRKLEKDALNKNDLVFENVQARARTAILMNTGFVLGTGDMSELALGWCTYNADQMSMYNVNAGVPKTLVRSLVEWIAEFEIRKTALQCKLYHTLRDICETDISPELLPTEHGSIVQKTEDILGPYELHDFFLYHFVRNGFRPDKIAWLAINAHGFSKKYKVEEVTSCLKTFMERFFSQQYKRQAVPDGPKIGSVDLNPRGDWRMPPDATPLLWTEQTL
jgi:NAD+ synthase (glutamine-hydrolysing)